MPQDDYDKKFGINPCDYDKHKNAFEQVSDIRKFEIDLYWKRATYFWALIAVAFAGYFAILSSEHIPNKLYLSMVVATVGLVFTFAWYLANRGSKYWQENWENHLDLLEDKITGPLYKSRLERPSLNGLSERLVTGPMSFSVSKINQWVSVFVISIWVTLTSFSAYKSLKVINIALDQWLIILAHGLVVVFALICCILMVSRGGSHQGDHGPNVRYRTTSINERI